jgi:hypothetical protein
MVPLAAMLPNEFIYLYFLFSTPWQCFYFCQLSDRVLIIFATGALFTSSLVLVAYRFLQLTHHLFLPVR